MDVILVSNYINNRRMFTMLDNLARETFGIELMQWKEAGLLGDNYIPYSYVSDGKILANVSANLYHVRVAGHEYPVVQIGTVMTSPSARGRGLSGRLMRYVISLYEKETAFIFLFANSSVMDFYPRFGFTSIAQKRFVFLASDIVAGESDLAPVSWRKDEDRAMILSVAGNRVPVSDQFALLGSVSPRTIMLSAEDFEGMLYYSASLDAIVCMSTAEDRLLVHGLFPRILPAGEGLPAYADRFLATLPLEGIREVECEFTIDASVPNVASGLVNPHEDGFFVRSTEPILIPGNKRLMPHDPARERRAPIDLTGLRLPEFDHT